MFVVDYLRECYYSERLGILVDSAAYHVHSLYQLPFIALHKPHRMFWDESASKNIHCITNGNAEMINNESSGT
jgi:hypothetical protein